jgi:hypothetical protein
MAKLEEAEALNELMGTTAWGPSQLTLLNCVKNALKRKKIRAKIVRFMYSLENEKHIVEPRLNSQAGIARR